MRARALATLTLWISLFVLLARTARADERTIYVAPVDTGARAAAESKAQAADATVQGRLHKALTEAAAVLNRPGSQTVTIRVASGTERSKLGAGTWTLPVVSNPEGVLRILGGYDAQFATRSPFTDPTVLLTAEGRSGPVLALDKKSTLGELVISGFVFDAAPANAYDEQTNTLLKGQSRTYVLLGFQHLVTDHLVIADNVFVNAPHGAFEPAIRPLSADTVVDIRNNFFVNNVRTLKVGAGLGYRNNTVRVVNLVRNTFVRNWPFNPQSTSASVAAVTLDNVQSARHLNIEGNLFAYNPGGALQHDWVPERMPKITLRGNLFYRNASLFGKDGKDAGVFVGKFGTNPAYLVLDLATVGEDLDYEIGGNVSMKPSIDLRPELTTEEDGDDLRIEGYAPKVEFSPGVLPFPGKRAARRFGVDKGQVWTESVPADK